MRYVWVVVAFIGVVVPGTVLSQATDPIQRYIKAEIYPTLYTYQNCAAGFLTRKASEYPDGRFDEHELGIRPECGRYIDVVRQRLLGIGWNAGTIEAEIDLYYGALRPRLMAAYEATRTIPAPPPSNAEDEAYRDRTREALLKELDEEYRSCIKRIVADVVPYSNERAEVLVDVVMTRCMDYERKRTQFVELLFDIPRERARSIVESLLQQERRQVLAAIVTFRAEVVKGALERLSPPEPPVTGSTGRPAKF